MKNSTKNKARREADQSGSSEFQRSQKIVKITVIEKQIDGIKMNTNEEQERPF